MRKIAISDIHGCYLTFKKLVRDVIQLTKEDELYLLGDYVDRGSGSKQVLDYIFELQDEGYKVRCLIGNHEEVFLKCIKGIGRFPDWLMYGGRMTLDSFGVNYPDEIPEKYVQFIENLEYYVEIDNYILVHAGLNFGSTEPLKDTFGMMWSRNWEAHVDMDWLGNRRIIYGHTPQTKSQVEFHLKHLPKQQLLNIDAGCYGTYVAGYGHLVAFDMTNEVIHFQENIDNMNAWRTHIEK